MSDKQLLEDAARAAGIDGWWEQEYLSFIKRDGGPWRPLTDDGDALRLFTTIDAAIYFVADQVYVTTAAGACAERYGDKNAATRRAIVRAAAELGKFKT